jgi:hypothetical protein
MTGKRLLAILLCVAVQQQADGSLKAVNGEGTPENLIVDTLALKSESWNEKSEGYRGIAADLMKGIAVAAGSIAQSMDMKAPEIKLGESSRQKDTAITQQSSQLSAGEQLVLAAQNNVTLIGAEVSTEGTAVLSGRNVTLEAAAETSTSETSRSEHTVGGLGGKLNKDEVSLGGMQEVEITETTTTTSTTHKGTTLNVGNLAVLATQDVNIVASKVEVEGQAIVQAGGDVNVTGKQDTTSTEKRTDIETTTVALAVRNAYVDTAMAVKALKDAFDALKDADKAYDDAKKRVESGELAKAALKDYETNRAMAAVNLAQAEIAAAASIAGAATAASQSMGTGFYVSGSAQKEVATTSTTQTASMWQGSSIDAGSLSISGQSTTIEGSDITAGWLTLDSDKVLITAGIDQYKNETSSSTKSVSASGGSNGSASASASTSSSKSSSTSLQNVNSRINVGHLESDADSFTLRGAEVTANTADLNVGSLTVQSLQDTSESSNSSKSTSVGVSNSTSKNGSSQSANVGVNRSNGSSEAQEVGNQTQLLIADGAKSQITAKDTTLIGGLIANATKNEDGTLTDHGKLNLTTETLTVSDLQDKSESEQSGWGFQTSTGRSADKKGDNVSYGGSGTTTVSMSKEGHKKEGETQATLGQGNIKVGGTDLSDQEQYADLNRNVNEGQITTLDQQTAGLNAGVTMDNRWLTSSGRESLLNDQKNLGKNSAMAAAGALADVARVGAAATAAVAEQSIDQAISAWDKVGNGQKLAYNAQLAGQVEALSAGEIQNAATVQEVANKVDQFLNGADGDRVQITEGTGVYGAAHKNNETIYLDMGTDGEGNSLLGSAVNTVAHEGGHGDGAGEISAAVTGFMTGLANSANAWANSEQIAVAKQAFMKELEAAPAVSEAENRALLDKNNSAFWEDAANNELDYRQLHPLEAQVIKDNAEAYAQKRGGISIEQAEAELTQRALRNIDSAHDKRLGSDDDAQAQAYLQALGAGQSREDGQTGQSFELFAADAETRNDHAMFGQYAKTSQTVETLLDQAYAMEYKPEDGQTIAELNGSSAGAVTGSDLALNDAARDYGNMRDQPAEVQWTVLGELRQERRENLQSQLQLTEELQALNAAGDTSSQAVQRRGEIQKQLTLLSSEDQFLRQASIVQLQAMGSVDLLNPSYQRESSEGYADTALLGLTLKGLSSGITAGRINALKGSIQEEQAMAASAKAAQLLESTGGANGGVVVDEAAALYRIGGNANGPVLNGKAPNTVLLQQAEKLSTAKPFQSTAPRDLNEQALWNRVLADPSAGRPLSQLSGDQRFAQSAGFTKMEASHRLPDGSSVSIHYQYNSITGKAYDIKIVTPQPSILQPGPSFTPKK